MNDNDTEKQKEADEITLKQFAEDFKKLLTKYPEVCVDGDLDGYVFANIYRGSLRNYSKIYLSRPLN